MQSAECSVKVRRYIHGELSLVDLAAAKCERLFCCLVVFGPNYDLWLSR